MIEFKLDKKDISVYVGLYIKEFVGNSNHIDDDLKTKMLNDIDVFTEDLKHTRFIKESINESIERWKKVNLNLADLWMKTATNNATNNNNPEKVANKVVNELKKQFNK